MVLRYWGIEVLKWNLELPPSPPPADTATGEEFGIWNTTGFYEIINPVIILINPRPNVPFGTGRREIQSQSVKSVIKILCSIQF